jgi:signal transduction histidine kinase
MTAGPPYARSAAVAALAVMRAAVRAPFAQQAGRELLFCVIAAPLGLGLAGLSFAVAGLAATPDSGVFVALAVATFAGLLLLILVTPAARGLGRAYRQLTARLLGERVAAPAPFRPGRDVFGRLDARLRDGTGWRAVAYLVLKLPVAVFELYAISFFWVDGLVNMTYPFVRAFRNHPPGVHLSGLPVLTPVPTPVGWLRVDSFPGTVAAFAVGAATVLAAPWVTRMATSVDRWLIRRLLGPGALARRVRDLEESRAHAVDNSTALLRRLERDLHDGAQIRLAVLAMNLGLAKEKLGDDGDPLDVAAARDLIDAAHRGAKDALTELRDLAKGIHPPVLDNGLADALTTLATRSAIPVELTTEIAQRPTPAIETIAYFCAAELLANAVKHSFANKIKVDVTGRGGPAATRRDRMLTLRVTDDGRGGADPARGSGLAGLAQRVAVVDGRMRIASPQGGPTRITVELPLRA